jgi:hypothetical protein
MATITPDQAAQLRSTVIDPALVEATHYATVNQRYYTVFKVGLLIVAILVALLSAYGATDMGLAKLASGVASALTVIATIISSFAFQEMNFQGRQNIWEAKRSALISLRGELIFDTEAASFRRRLDEVLGWNENNPPKGLPPPTLGKPQEAAPAG